jgi:hypothetical protein
MKSLLFGNAKVDTSFGRRSANLKRAASSVNTIDDDEVSKHHSRATVRYNANTHKNSKEEACSEIENSSKTEQLTEIISRSLPLFKRQALEKERQKNNFLKERILRDKLAALSQKQNLISQRYSALLNR